MTPLDALTRYLPPRRPTPRDPRALKTGVLDDAGHAQYYAIPSPVALAETFVVPTLAARLDLFRDRTSGVLVRPLGSEVTPTPRNVRQIADAIAVSLRGLPDVPGASDAYVSLRRFVALASPGLLDRYALDVAAAMRRRDVLPEWAPPKPAREPSAPRTADELRAAASARKARLRAAHLAAEKASTRAWLALYLEDAEPGAVLEAPALYAEAAEVIDEWAVCDDPIDEDDPESPAFRVPGSRTFYAVADEVLGARRRTSAVYVYTIPNPVEAAAETASTQEENPVNEVFWDTALAARQATEDVQALTAATHAHADAVERLLALQQAQHAEGDRSGALHTQRERLAATGTDGAPVDLGAYRAARR